MPAILIFPLMALVSTLTGGIAAIRLRAHLETLLGLTFGVVMGVVCLDLLPEIFSTSAREHLNVNGPMLCLVAGFLGCGTLTTAAKARFGGAGCGLETHTPAVHPASAGTESAAELLGRKRAGVIGALGLVGHSFFDGVAVGLACRVSASTGVLVATAVIAHDFADGFNTASVMLNARNNLAACVTLLALDALAPLCGALSTLVFRASTPVVLCCLGIFCGVLLHIATTELLPRARMGLRNPVALCGLAGLGVTFVWIVQQLVG